MRFEVRLTSSGVILGAIADSEQEALQALKDAGLLDEQAQFTVRRVE